MFDGIIRDILAIAVFVGVGLTLAKLLKGAGEGGCSIPGAMLDGPRSSAGKVAGGAGQGLGTSSGRVNGITLRVGKLLSKAGHAAGSVLGGLGVGVAAIGAAGTKGARRGANVVGEAAKKVASLNAARRVRSAAKHASVTAKASLRTEAWALIDDVTFGLGMEPNARNEQRPYSAFAWEIDPTVAEELRDAFEEFDVRYDWHQDPETDEWYVIFPTEEIDFARQVMSEAGFAVDDRGVPAAWYEPVESEVYDEDTGDWTPVSAREEVPAGGDVAGGNETDGVPFAAGAPFPPARGPDGNSAGVEEAVFGTEASVSQTVEPIGEEGV